MKKKLITIPSGLEISFFVASLLVLHWECPAADAKKGWHAGTKIKCPL